MILEKKKPSLVKRFRLPKKHLINSCVLVFFSLSFLFFFLLMMLLASLPTYGNIGDAKLQKKKLYNPLQETKPR